MVDDSRVLVALAERGEPFTFTFDAFHVSYAGWIPTVAHALCLGCQYVFVMLWYGQEADDNFFVRAQQLLEVLTGRRIKFDIVERAPSLYRKYALVRFAVE